MTTSALIEKPTLETTPAKTGVDPDAVAGRPHAELPPLLRQLGASLLVTTYQAGKLVMVRDEGDHLNTHFRGLPGPRWAWPYRAIGWRWAPRCRSGNLSMFQPWPPGWNRRVGTTPASCRAPATSPATSRATRWPGAIRLPSTLEGEGLREREELWVVNTRFSCRCTLDGSAELLARCPVGGEPCATQCPLRHRPRLSLGRYVHIKP